MMKVAEATSLISTVSSGEVTGATLWPPGRSTGGLEEDAKH